MADEVIQGPGETLTDTLRPSQPSALPIEVEPRISAESLADRAPESPVRPPAEPFKHPLEAMFDGEEKAARKPEDQIKHETTDALANTAAEVKPPVAPPEIPPAAPAELTPPKEAAPAVPPSPKVEPPKVQTEAENRAFAEARRAEKARKEAMEELQQERGRLLAMEAERQRFLLEQQARTQQEQEGVYQPEPDPFQVLQSEVQQLRQELATKSLDDQLNTQATVFQREHPDYNEALQYYIADERRDAEESGELDVVAERVLAVAAVRVAHFAQQQGLTRAQAAREMAVGVIFENRKSALVQAMQRTGKSVVETVYNRAHRRGFRPASNGNGAAATPEIPAAPDPMISAVAQVEQEQRRGASESLSTMPRSNATPPRSFMSRNEVMSYLQTLDVREADKFMDSMDRKDPRWMERLPG